MAMVGTPTVEETKHKFSEQGFSLHVNATAEGDYLAQAVNMDPRQGRGNAPIGSGTTPEQAAFDAWAIFENDRAKYLGSA
jgi:hypothetical protein